MYPTFASCEEMFLTLSWSNISLLEAAAKPMEPKQ